MCWIERPIAGPNAASLLELAHIFTTFRHKSAKTDRLKPRLLAGLIGFRRFLISHRIIHSDRESRQDEAKRRCAWPM